MRDAAGQNQDVCAIVWADVDACMCRRAIPLAVALLHVSNPDMTALDTLSRLSHDADSEVAQSAVLALGECQILPCQKLLLMHCLIAYSLGGDIRNHMQWKFL